MKCVSLLVLLIAFASAGAVRAQDAGAAVAAPVTNTWVRVAGADARASVAANWSLKHVPTADEIVFFGPRHPTDCVWDAAAPHKIGGLVSDLGYIAILQINTCRDGSFDALRIEKSLDWNGGAITSPSNNDVDQYRLVLDIGGDLNLSEEAIISVSAKGFAPGKGPSPGQSAGDGAAHGGQGAPRSGNTPATPQSTYGSILHPDASGSGGTLSTNAPANVRGPYGGGVLKITAEGNVNIWGRIRADAEKGSNPSVQPYFLSGAAGGSIEIRGRRVVLQGNQSSISAVGGDAYAAGGGGGGGGRIAVYFSDSNASNFQHIMWSGWQRHRGSTSGGCGACKDRDNRSIDRHIRGAAGTVYYEGLDKDQPNGGTCLLNNWQLTSLAYTRLPADSKITAGAQDEMRDVHMFMGDNAALQLAGQLEVRYLTLDASTIDLNGSLLVTGTLRQGDKTLTTPTTYRDNRDDPMVGDILFSGGRLEIRPYLPPLAF